MNLDEEKVVLVDEKGKLLGTRLKQEVHGLKTPLHRGFSIFLFDSRGRVLVQRRALGKQTWPGVWSNSCCGHPAPGESYETAVRRRVKDELGVDVGDLRKVADYRYKFVRFGVMENEICPVFVGRVMEEVRPNPNEVMDVGWVDWEEFLRELEEDNEGKWSEWCKEEVKLVERCNRSQE